MTEEEAKTKWCPMVRQPLPSMASEQISVNREGGNDSCLASGCMMWRILPQHATCYKNEPEGYCGLGGKP